MIKVQIRGIEELQRKLNRVQSAETFRRPIHRSLLLMQNRMADYPPPPGGSRYRRTGTLGRRWTSARPQITERGDIVSGRIGNNTSYAPFVQSRRFQRATFRGRWKTAEQIVKEETGTITRFFQEAADEALRG